MFLSATIIRNVQKIAEVIDVEPSQVEEWAREDQSEECVIKK